jgi:hypothetical protein
MQSTMIRSKYYSPVSIPQTATDRQKYYGIPPRVVIYWNPI